MGPPQTPERTGFLPEKCLLYGSCVLLNGPTNQEALPQLFGSLHFCASSIASSGRHPAGLAQTCECKSLPWCGVPVPREAASEHRGAAHWGFLTPDQSAWAPFPLFLTLGQGHISRVSWVHYSVILDHFPSEAHTEASPPTSVNCRCSQPLGWEAQAPWLRHESVCPFLPLSASRPWEARPREAGACAGAHEQLWPVGGPGLSLLIRRALCGVGLE